MNDLTPLIAAYDAKHSEASHYDEVLDEVAGRCIETGSLGKLDIGALVFWKRLRANTPWAEHLLDKSESDVRKVTAEAVRCARDESLSVPEAARLARTKLVGLPGFQTGDAVASALIVAAAPDRMAVYDKNAHAGLRELGLELSNASGRYGRYMGLIEQLRAEVNATGRSWRARDVDLALYWLGGEQDQPEDAGS